MDRGFDDQFHTNGRGQVVDGLGLACQCQQLGTCGNLGFNDTQIWIFPEAPKIFDASGREIIDDDNRISVGDKPFDDSAVAAVRNVGRIPELQNLDRATFDKLYRQRRMVFKPEDLDL